MQRIIDQTFTFQSFILVGRYFKLNETQLFLMKCLQTPGQLYPLVVDIMPIKSVESLLLSHNCINSWTMPKLNLISSNKCLIDESMQKKNIEQKHISALTIYFRIVFFFCTIAFTVCVYLFTVLFRFVGVCINRMPKMYWCLSNVWNFFEKNPTFSARIR